MSLVLYRTVKKQFLLQTSFTTDDATTRTPNSQPVSYQNPELQVMHQHSLYSVKERQMFRKMIHTSLHLDCARPRGTMEAVLNAREEYMI